MTDEQKIRALNALGNASNAISDGRPWVAEQWADSAASMIREANLSAMDTGRLVAPRDGATTGDRVAILLSIGVLLWMIGAMITDFWTLP